MNAHLLVVDDEPNIVELLSASLRFAGYDVSTATNGTEALKKARSIDPDLVVLDVMMPGLDGWRVAEELLEDPATSSIPIVFLTARAELRDRARGLDLGGLDYVTKPFNPVELAPLIRDLIARVEGGEREELRRAKLAELRQLIEEG
jgi:two-component system, OmpR family, response regulator